MRTINAFDKGRLSALKAASLVSIQEDLDGIVRHSLWVLLLDFTLVEQRPLLNLSYLDNGSLTFVAGSV
ncbi:MAG: hypothetical protein IPL77_12015 [Flavobacteriales bacterium]|nr:hypothetical protein [Flavobacteriales bacterium]